MHRVLIAFVLAMAAGGCAARAVPGSGPALARAPMAEVAGPIRYKAVMIAGDGSLPVFDNAIEAVTERLRRGGALVGVERLSAAPSVIRQDGVRSASLSHVLGAISSMAPGPGEGCLVYGTSHGAQFRGFVLAGTGEVLSPGALDRALAEGCGEAPTVVVISACFSGIFAEGSMARPNRIVLTAARRDRASFGCGAGRDYTVYDRCLVDALGGPGGGGTPWGRVHDAVGGCVRAEERRLRVLPSVPQGWFGPMVAGLAVPGG